MRPPLMTVRNQSSSVRELLSVLSPVVMANWSGAPVAGAPRKALIRSTSEIAPGTVSASWGRQACTSVERRYSRRIGCWLSIRCRSVSCTNAASGVRRPARPAFGAARSERTLRLQPAPSPRRR